MTLHSGIRYAMPDRIISPNEKKRTMVVVIKADFDGSVHSSPVQEEEKKGHEQSLYVTPFFCRRLQIRSPSTDEFITVTPQAPPRMNLKAMKT